MLIKKFYRPDEESRRLRRPVDFFTVVSSDNTEYEIRKEQIFDRVLCPDCSDRQNPTTYLSAIVREHLNCSVLSLSEVRHSACMGILAKSFLPYELNDAHLNALATKHGHLPWANGDVTTDGVTLVPCNNSYCVNRRLDSLIPYPQFLTSAWCTRDKFVGEDLRWILAVDQIVAWQVIRQSLINSKTRAESIEFVFASSLPMLYKNHEINPGVLRPYKTTVIMWDDPAGFVSNEAISLIQMYLQSSKGRIFVIDENFESSKLNSMAIQMVLRSCGVRQLDARSIPQLEIEMESLCG